MKLADLYKEEFFSLCPPLGMSDSDITEVYSHNWCITHKFQNIATKAPLHGVN